MKRLLLAASLCAGCFAFGSAATAERTALHQPRRCAQLFTVHMGARAARAVYSATRHVSRHNLRLLGYIERCQRNPRAQPYVRWYDHHQAYLHRERIVAHIALIRDNSFAYGQWAIPPSIVKCESTYQNLPPNGAGASGYYQIIPSTWASYGGTRYAPEAYEASKYDQSVIAARIWNGGNGASQWVCKA